VHAFGDKHVLCVV